MDFRSLEGKSFLQKDLRGEYKHTRAARVLSEKHGQVRILNHSLAKPNGKLVGRSLRDRAGGLRRARKISYLSRFPNLSDAGRRMASFNNFTEQEEAESPDFTNFTSVAVQQINRARGVGSWFRQRKKLTNAKSQQKTVAASKKIGRRAARLTRVQIGKTAGTVKVVAVKIVAAFTALFTSMALPLIGVLAAVLALVAVISSIFSFIFDLVGADSSADFQANDDYPWAAQVRNAQGLPAGLYNTINSETRYYYGNCTDFVFWRVNRDMGGKPGAWVYTYSDLTPLGGNGKAWGEPGNLPGWELVRDVQQISAGDVISYKPYVYGSHPTYGHVAYVAGNDGKQIVVENYGFAKYYVTAHEHSQLRDWISSGAVVIKKNPRLSLDKRLELAQKKGVGQ